MQEKPKKANRDYPLANTPEPTPLYLQTQAAIQAGRSTGGSLIEIAKKRDSERRAKKAMDEARERLNRTPPSP
jgi:hypothetical protein